MPNVAYTGQVRDQANNPISGAAVIVRGPGGLLIASVSDAQGIFAFTVPNQPAPLAAELTVQAKFFIVETRNVVLDPGATNLGPMILTPRPPKSFILHPYGVTAGDVDTGFDVMAGDEVSITAEGLVDFGCGWIMCIGAPILDANGDNQPTPGDYPAPALRKNSLIVRIANRYYQGGTNAMFRSDLAGRMVLRTNDKDTGDNSRGWTVRIVVNRMYP